MLFAGDIRGTTDTDLLAWLCHDEPASSSVREASANLVNGVYADLSQFDEVIKRLAPAIPVNLLALVDRNILRVAIYELTNRDTVPRQVVVNEAVELASMFGSESSARFVNGVLGSYLADLATAAEKPDQLPGNPTVGGVPK